MVFYIVLDGNVVVPSFFMLMIYYIHMTPEDIKKFQKKVYDYYKNNKRVFPWRKTTNSYRILVSEIMLQQTQTHRVEPKYNEFIKTFPTAKSLVSAPLADVLRQWQGLGYNRRGMMLHRAAQEIVARKKFPDTLEDVLTLPGVGKYTAGAIMAFAFNKPVPIIETNIRTVYLHEFFKDKKDVGDEKLMPLIKQTLDKKNPREWYYALMDYGVMIKKNHGNANRLSKHYTTQSKFVGSNREVRGAILKALVQKPLTHIQLFKELSFEKERVHKALDGLMNDSIVKKKGLKYRV